MNCKTQANATSAPNVKNWGYLESWKSTASSRGARIQH